MTNVTISWTLKLINLTVYPLFRQDLIAHHSLMSSSSPTRRRICIVGAGSAGMSAAYALSQHPDKYAVTVYEKEDVTGGMATSIEINADEYGASCINDGVQGCSPAFVNTIRMFRVLGFESTKVGMQ